MLAKKYFSHYAMWVQMTSTTGYALNFMADTIVQIQQCQKETVVPEYRTVVGEHADLFGRTFIVPSDFSFVNETRIRNGIEELESLLASRNTVLIHDPSMCELIRKHLKVEVYSFRFSAIHLKGVMAAIVPKLEQSYFQA